MIKESRESKEVTKVVSVLNSQVCICDVCGKIIYKYEKALNNNINKIGGKYYFHITESNSDFGRDYSKSQVEFDVCSEECMHEKISEFNKHCESNNTQEIKITQIEI